MKRLFVMLALSALMPIGAMAQHIGTGLSNHTIAARADGTVYTWGYNYDGQLGNGYNSDSAVPVEVVSSGVLSGKTITQIAAGLQHSIALASDGTAYTWGYNLRGQLGNNSWGNSAVPVAVYTGGVLSGKTITQVAAGTYHSIALASDGTVYTWGQNNQGQLGSNSNMDNYTYYNVPVAVYTSGVLSGKTITQVAAGASHSIALASDGTVYTWGDNANGQLGNGNTGTDSNVPVAVDTSGALSGKTITKVAAGNLHSIALASDGTVYTWGYNGAGQLGNNSTTSSNVPVAVYTSGVLSEKTITQVAAGASHAIALASDGTVYTWGDNANGQLGNNSTTRSKVPVAVYTSGVLSEKTITQVAAGNLHSIAIASGDTVFTWGKNDNGQLGNGNTGTNSTVPVKVVLLAVPTAQPTNLIISSEVNTVPEPDENDISLSWTASASADKYLVVRNVGSAPTFEPSDGTEYSAGAQSGGTVIYSGSSTSATDANVSSGTYYYELFGFNGSGANTLYLRSNPLSGNVAISTDGTLTLSNSGGAAVSAAFPNSGVNISFPDGTSGTNLSVTKTTSVPSAIFQGNPGVRGMKPLYFSITSSNETPGNYTIVLDFSALSNMTEAKWNLFKIMKRADANSPWKNITGAPHNGTIENRQTDGVWGKFTISGLSSFSEFGGGEATLVVTSNADDGAGTLRQTIADASDDDVIEFDVSSMGSNKITLSTTLDIIKSVTLRALGSDNGVILDGNNSVRVVDISDAKIVTLKNMKIQNGYDDTDLAGGIWNNGDLTLINCVISDNREENSSLGVGGILQYSEGGDNIADVLTLINCTISNNDGRNSSAGGTGGLLCDGGELYVRNTIIYGNFGDTYADVDEDVTVCDECNNSCIGNLGSITISSGANNISTNPQFAGSEINAIHPYNIASNSPCADTGNDAYCDESYDIKGSGRKLLKTDGNTTGTIDMGAYEYLGGPTTQANSIVFSSVEYSSMTVSWTNGNGSSRAVFIKQANSGTATPVDNTTYTANTSFGSGTQIGSTGWYCIYNGTGTSVSVTGLSGSTDYIVQVFEYNGYSGAEYYFTSTATDNPKSTSTTAAINYALSFDGNDDNVTLPATLYSSNFSSQSAITIEYWFKGTVLQSPVRFQDGGGWIVAGWGSNVPEFIISTDGSTDGVAIIGAEDGEWHHIACVWQKNTFNGFQAYVDGVITEQKSSDDVNLPSISSGAWLGSFEDGEYLNGQLEEVRIWNVARTSEQINAYKNVELTGSEEGLIAYYQMSDGSGTALTDDSQNSYNGTINGAAWTIVSSNDLSLPVTLSSFTGRAVKAGVVLEWETCAEIENLGFIIRKSEVGSRELGEEGKTENGTRNTQELVASYQTHSALQGQGSVSKTTLYSYTDTKVEAGKSYVYTLSDVDYSGKETMQAEVKVKVESERTIIADSYTLRPVYPNPFNATFTVPFTLNEPMTVSIALYNIQGQRVMDILNQELNAGEYHFAVNADELGSGVYFLNTSLKGASGISGSERSRSDRQSHTQKIIVMK